MENKKVFSLDDLKHAFDSGLSKGINKLNEPTVNFLGQWHYNNFNEWFEGSFLKSKLQQKQDFIAITYCYTQDNIPYQKVVGFFDPSKIDDGIKEIKEGMIALGRILVEEMIDENHQFYVSFKSDENGEEWFYTGTFEIDKLIL